MPDRSASSNRATRPTVIRTPDQRLRVFVSSTLQEVVDERAAAREAITHLHLAPVLFELGARPHPPQELYRAYLDQSHIFIGIYWQKYGWVAPDMDISGLEDEYRLSGNKPKLIYIKQPAPDREPRLKELLDRIKSDNAASYKYFSSANELRELIENDLLLLLTERFEAATLTPAVDEAASTQPSTNVPIPRNLLVGRERELAAVQDLLLRDDVNLVTMTGTGGAGKSRLALEVARNLLDRFHDGVFLVRLTPILDANLVVATVAETLDIRESTGGRTLLEMLKDRLRDKHLLLVMDNFEQVIAAAPVAAQLLESCPHLKILATSRVALHVRGEKEVPLAPLPLPQDKSIHATEQALQSAAVQLFVQRAQAANPSFALTDKNAPIVVEICRRLDGLPLALELAAARIRILSPQMLLARLENRLAILSGGTRDLPSRQQTLRSSIDWSYNLLADDAKVLFRRLGVFVGGWTLEAAEAVCPVDGDLSADVLDELGALVDNSLLAQVESIDGETRFSMLETIREYALERLSENPIEAKRIERQHADFFRQLAEAAAPQLASTARYAWLPRLGAERDNLRAALAWTKVQPDPDSELHIVSALGWYWYFNGSISEGRANAEHALTRMADSARTPSHAMVLFSAGTFAGTQAENSIARERLIESTTIFRELGDKHGCAYALLFLALVTTYQDKPDLPSVMNLFQESIHLFRETKDKWGEAYALTCYGDALLVPGDVAVARSILDTGLKLWREVDDSWGIGTHLFIMGSVAWYDGDYATARAQCQEAVDRLRHYSDKWGLARGLLRLGYALLYLGELQPARARLTESLTLFQEVGNQRGIIYCLSGLGGVAAKIGQPERAARIFGAIQALSGATSVVEYGLDRARYQRTLALARTEAKDESAWNAAYAEGRAMTIEQVIAYALEAASH